MEKRKGIWIPIEIIEDDNLDWLNKVLLSEIISYSKLPSGCIASNDKFAELLSIHTGNVSKRISHLVGKGYIKLQLIKIGEKRTKRIIIPQKGLSGNAHTTERIRTEDYAETQEGLSGNAQRNERERLPNITSTNSVIETSINSDINSFTNIEKNEEDIIQEGMNKLMLKYNITNG